MAYNAGKGIWEDNFLITSIVDLGQRCCLSGAGQCVISSAGLWEGRPRTDKSTPAHLGWAWRPPSTSLKIKVKLCCCPWHEGTRGGAAPSARLLAGRRQRSASTRGAASSIWYILIFLICLC